MSLSIVNRADVSTEDWDTFVEGHPRGEFWHTTRWIDYSLAYAPSSVDVSTATICDGHIVAILPCVMFDDVRTHGGQPPPDALIETSAFPNLDVSTIPPGREMHVVDLRDGGEAAQWRRLRRSYKSLIHRAPRAYDIWILGGTDNCDDAMHQVQEVHRQAAGRQTRPSATWDLMTQWLSDGHGIVALARRKGEWSSSALSGFAYAIRWKDWSYWASGATLVPNLQHALQWELMKALRCNGHTRYYEIGGLADDSTEKERNIAFFKMGFGARPMRIADNRVNRLTESEVS